MSHWGWANDFWHLWLAKRDRIDAGVYYKAGEGPPLEEPLSLNEFCNCPIHTISFWGKKMPHLLPINKQIAIWYVCVYKGYLHNNYVFFIYMRRDPTHHLHSTCRYRRRRRNWHRRIDSSSNWWKEGMDGLACCSFFSAVIQLPASSKHTEEMIPIYTVLHMNNKL